MAIGRTQLKISSDEINAIIYSYLEDAGFTHTAFNLRNEAKLDSSPNASARIPRGELVSLLTKALMYTEVEAHYKRDPNDPPCTAPFSIIHAHNCNYGTNALPSPPPPETNRGRSEVFPPPKAASPTPKPPSTTVVNGTASPPKVTVTRKPGERISKKGYGEGVVLLNGHESEVFISQWHPHEPSMLATGSKDYTARIWDVPTPPAPLRVPPTLKHTPEIGTVHDITAVEWNKTGEVLATSCFDGLVRLWDSKGEHKLNLAMHSGPVFTVKWSPCSNWLLSASLDSSVIVWNMLTHRADKVEQVFRFHNSSVLDAIWLDSNTLVSCGGDRLVQVCRIGSPQPVRIFSGHRDTVDLLKVTSDLSLLVSTSDDHTAIIWDLNVWKQEGPNGPRSIPDGQTDPALKCVLTGHTQVISSVQWVPNPAGSEYTLATTAFDNTVRLWDTRSGTCIQELKDHTNRVYSCSVSGRGRYLATASADGKVYVYDLSRGELAFEWDCELGSIYYADWQKNGDRLALCLENKGVVVLDMPSFGFEDSVQ